MANAIDTFGFEILQELYRNEIQKKEDVIILFLHWYLTKIGFKCIGIGSKSVRDPSEKESELLPKEWNTHPNYTMRYVKDEKLYMLYGIKSDAEILLNFMKFENDLVSNIHLPIEETVFALHGSLETMIPSFQTILRNIQKDFVEPIYAGTVSTAKNQAATTHQKQHVAPQQNRNPLAEPVPPQLPPYGLPDLGGVGAADLYPPGVSGGGMIFDPFSNKPFGPRYNPSLGIPGRLPPAAIPPGARFDPFGPPDLDPPRPHHRRPDDDHLPPPRFHEDMFM